MVHQNFTSCVATCSGVDTGLLEWMSGTVQEEEGRKVSRIVQDEVLFVVNTSWCCVYMYVGLSYTSSMKRRCSVM